MRKFKLTLALLMFVLPLPGCRWFGFSVQEPSRRIEWVLGVDVTPTVPKEQFTAYPQIAAEAVLACLHSRDRVYQLAINSDAEKLVKTFDIGGGKTGITPDAKALYESLQAVQRDNSRAVTTNIASLLSYVKKVVNQSRQERAALQQRDKSMSAEAQYVAVLLTDGEPDGQQTIDSGEWPTDVQVWAFGVKAENETKFRDLCTAQLKIPAANLHIKQFSTWKSDIRDFGPALGRKPNQALVTEITTGQQAKNGL